MIQFKYCLKDWYKYYMFEGLVQILIKSDKVDKGNGRVGYCDSFMNKWFFLNKVSY